MTHGPLNAFIPGTGALPLDLVESAKIVGGYQWLEFRLFEVAGEWVTNEPDPRARVMFDALSRQHAWHAELWEERIPIIEGVVDPAEVSGAPTPGAAELFDTLGSHSGGGGTLGRLVGLARVVYPRLVCGYAHHLRRLSEASDAPIVRALRLVLRDESEAWQAAEYLVQGLIRRPHDVEVVTAHQQHLEEFVVGTGPGLVAWPQDPQH